MPICPWSVCFNNGTSQWLQDQVIFACKPESRSVPPGVFPCSIQSPKSVLSPVLPMYQKLPQGPSSPEKSQGSHCWTPQDRLGPSEQSHTTAALLRKWVWEWGMLKMLQKGLKEHKEDRKEVGTGRLYEQTSSCVRDIQRNCLVLSMFILNAGTDQHICSLWECRQHAVPLDVCNARWSFVPEIQTIWEREYLLPHHCCILEGSFPHFSYFHLQPVPSLLQVWGSDQQLQDLWCWLGTASVKQSLLMRYKSFLTSFQLGSFFCSLLWLWIIFRLFVSSHELIYTETEIRAPGFL